MIVLGAEDTPPTVKQLSDSSMVSTTVNGFRLSAALIPCGADDPYRLLAQANQGRAGRGSRILLYVPAMRGMDGRAAQPQTGGRTSGDGHGCGAGRYPTGAGCELPGTGCRQRQTIV